MSERRPGGEDGEIGIWALREAGDDDHGVDCADPVAPADQVFRV